MINRAYYSDTIANFLSRSVDEVVGRLARASPFPDEPAQKAAWVAQIPILRSALSGYATHGKVYLEFGIPRLGKRIDAVAVVRNVVFVIEFKVEETRFYAHAVDQVVDYALDLKHFHETSHLATLAPILVATKADSRPFTLGTTAHQDSLLLPLCIAADDLGGAIAAVLAFASGATIDPEAWEHGRYNPTPTIIEAALTLYSGHKVEDIARSEAGRDDAINLTRTSAAVSQIVAAAQAGGHKSICFVTGVPGAGKTLVGLNTATLHASKEDALHSVFLSGNGPLVTILREALARDKVAREKDCGRKCTLKDARREVRAIIQNVHEFRDEYARHDNRAPNDHVVIFDEAQRAWNQAQTSAFMKRKRGLPGFAHSEPEFLISCMNRHADWSVIVCLVGGGQEINTGEAGIGEWVESVLRSFSGWHVHISPHLKDSEYGAGSILEKLEGRPNVQFDKDLHLAVSMRSFRAEHVSGFVKALLDREEEEARRLIHGFKERYPIALTRSMDVAKEWLRGHALGSERYGLVVSSQAQRLKPCPVGIDVRVQTDPVHYFLAPKSDVRSSYYLEDAVTEFDVQGLELDWTGVVWDGDFRHSAESNGWGHFEFRGSDWIRVNKRERQMYLKNAYRVLLTRARQGMIVVVPDGDPRDATRDASFYDPTFEYLKDVGLAVL